MPSSLCYNGVKFIPHCSLYRAVIGTTQLVCTGEAKGDDGHTKRIVIQMFELWEGLGLNLVLRHAE